MLKTLCLILITLVVCEIIARSFCYFFKFDNDFDRRARSVLGKHEVIRTDNGVWGAETVHPYFGYVFQCANSESKNSVHCPYGFSTSEDILRYTDSKNFNIVFLSGSVCNNVFREASSEIRAFFRQYTNKQINLFFLGAGAYKQPQQVWVLSYLLLLGAQIDAVVLIDGYNELVVPWYNYRSNVDYSYPYAWRERLHTTSQSINETALGYIFILRDIREGSARLFFRYLRFSRLFSALGTAADILIDKVIVHLSTQHLYSRATEAGYIGEANPPDVKSVIEKSCTLWARSALMINAICSSRDILFVHALQPNQYVHGKKELTYTEKKVALSEYPYTQKFREDKSLNAIWIPEGYKQMIQLGRQLAQKYIFIDATDVFNDVKYDIYVDTCCHVNRTGSILIWKCIERGARDKVAAFMKKHH